MIISDDVKRKYAEKLIKEILKDKILLELKSNKVDSLFTKQYNMNFKNHKKYYDELVIKGISPRFIEFNNGVALFKIKSSKWNSIKRKFAPTEYELGIRFMDWHKFYDDPQLSMNARMDRLMMGELGIGCGCPSFYYNYGYQTYIKGAQFYNEEFDHANVKTPAPITNPQNIGIGCKHLARLLNKWNYRLYVRQEVKNAIIENMPQQMPQTYSPSAPNSKVRSVKRIETKNRKKR